jgi:hypothetical protein
MMAPGARQASDRAKPASSALKDPPGLSASKLWAMNGAASRLAPARAQRKGAGTREGRNAEALFRGGCYTWTRSLITRVALPTRITTDGQRPYLDIALQREAAAGLLASTPQA